MIMRPRKAPMPMATFAPVERVEVEAEIGACEGMVMDEGVSEPVMNDLELMKEGAGEEEGGDL